MLNTLLLLLWSQSGSNRRPSACKADALPAELWPLLSTLLMVVGLDRLELSTPRLSSVCSNQLSYRPFISSALLLLLSTSVSSSSFSSPSNQCGHLHRHLSKEVIQPQVPLRLPCYDFTPVMNHTVVSVPPKVKLPTSGTTHSHGVTGGVYKARERIHRDILIRDY